MICYLSVTLIAPAPALSLPSKQAAVGPLPSGKWRQVSGHPHHHVRPIHWRVNSHLPEMVMRWRKGDGAENKCSAGAKVRNIQFVQLLSGLLKHFCMYALLKHYNNKIKF